MPIEKNVLDSPIKKLPEKWEQTITEKNFESDKNDETTNQTVNDTRRSMESTLQESPEFRGLAEYIKASEEAIEALKQEDAKEVAIIHHNDGDGISCGAILKASLEREGYKVKTIVLEKVYKEVVEIIYERIDTPIFFTDLGGGAAEEIARINMGKNLTIIVDHHHTERTITQMEASVHNLSSDAFIPHSGGGWTSGSSIAWRFAQVLNEKNRALAHLGVIGAVSDKHDVSGKLTGLNREVLKVAVEAGDVRIENIGGREQYTLTRFGEESPISQLADEVTLLGSIQLYDDGIKRGMKIVDRGYKSSDMEIVEAATKRQTKAFDALMQEMGREHTEREYIWCVDSKEHFKGMALKLIGTFLGFVRDGNLASPDKYLIGFQDIQPEILNLGNVGEGLVKVSGRLGLELSRQVDAKKMPGYSHLFHEVARRLCLSMDAFHNNAAALVIRADQKEEFLNTLQQVISENIPGQSLDASRDVSSIPPCSDSEDGKIHPKILELAQRTEAIHLGALVFDIDRTILPDEITPLHGDNLEAIVEALESGVKIVLLSGSPYYQEVEVKIYDSPEEDAHTIQKISFDKEAIQVRCTTPIQEALRKRGTGRFIGNLEIITVSGVENASFSYDEEAKKYNEEFRVNPQKLISPRMQLEIGRSLAVAYLMTFARIVLKEEDKFKAIIEAISNAENFNDVRTIFEKAIKKFSKARFWLFDSEIVILDHENQLNSVHTNAAVEEALEMFDLPENEYFPRSGDAFVKITRSEKGNALRDYMREENIRGLTVAIGDSLTDDFLWTEVEGLYLPVYLGRAEQVAEHAQVMVARHKGEDNLKDRHTGKLIRLFLKAMQDKKKYHELGFFDPKKKEIIVGPKKERVRNIEEFSGFIFDMDGVLFRGMELIPGAVETLQQLQEEGRNFVCLTNNSTRSRSDFQKIIDNLGLPIEAENIIPSTYATAEYLRKRDPQAKIYVIGAPGLMEELNLAELHITNNPEEADYLVTGADPNLNSDKFAAGVKALSGKAKWIAVSADRLHPTPEGMHAGGGSIVGALNRFSGKLPDILTCKPSREIMEVALKKLGLHAREALMVGDTLASDIRGGKNAGISTCLVMSGATSKKILEQSPINPDFTLGSVQGILDCLTKSKPSKKDKKEASSEKENTEKPKSKEKIKKAGVYVIGSDAFIEKLKAEGFKIAEKPETAEYLVTCPGLNLGVDEINAGVQALHSGAKWIVYSVASKFSDPYNTPKLEDSLTEEVNSRSYGALYEKNQKRRGIMRDDNSGGGTVDSSGLLVGALSYCVKRDPDFLVGEGQLSVAPLKKNA